MSQPLLDFMVLFVIFTLVYLHRGGRCSGITAIYFPKNLQLIEINQSIYENSKKGDEFKDEDT